MCSNDERLQGKTCATKRELPHINVRMVHEQHANLAVAFVATRTVAATKNSAGRNGTRII